jgi:hypothetical protein
MGTQIQYGVAQIPQVRSNPVLEVHSTVIGTEGKPDGLSSGYRLWFWGFGETFV